MSIEAPEALVVALITILINFCIQFFFKWWDKRTNGISIQNAIVAEVVALKNIISERNYQEAIRSVIKFLEENPNKKMLLSVDVQLDVFPVYSSNLDKIGQLDPKLSPKIVTFYALLSSIIQDVKIGGLLNNTEHSNLESYKNINSLLDKAISIADTIITFK